MLRHFITMGCLGLFAGGCATGTEDTEDDGGGGGQPPSATFDYRAPIDLGGAPEGVSIELVVPHGALVLEDKALANGDDLRIYFDDGSGSTELDRFLDPASSWNTVSTKIWFRTQPGAGSYHLYYGYPAASDPPDDPGKVFLLYEGFDGADYDADWTYSAVGVNAVNTSAATSQGRLSLRGRGADVGGTADSMVYFHRELEGDFAVDVGIAGESSSGGAAKLGGVMMRESLDPDARFASVLLLNAPSGQPRSFLDMRRTAQGATVEQNNQPAAVEFPYFMRLLRFQGSTSAQYSANGLTYQNVGGTTVLGLTDPVLVGVPYSNASGADGTLFVEYIRVRRVAAFPEPVATLGEEESL
jgi:hypothetical protein